MAGRNRTYYQFSEGTGRKAGSVQGLDGGGNTVDSPVFVLDEPFLATYSIGTNTALSTATANSHLLEIMAGASLHVWVRRLVVTQRAAAGATAVCTFGLYRLSTAGTGGTSLTPAPHDPADTAGCTAMALPSSKGTETTLLQPQTGSLWSAIPATDDMRVVGWDFTTRRSKGLRIPAGTSNGLCLKNLDAVASATVVVYAEVCESDYF